MSTENKDYVEFKTIDNTIVRIKKSTVGAVEEIPSTSRTEGYVKVYTAGFAFQLALPFDEVTKALFS